MPFAQRALLLSVVLASCALLPMTVGSAGQRLEKSDKSEVELIDLLKRLREKLNSDKAAAETEMKSDEALTDEQEKQLVDAINSKRSSQGASNMNKISWNDDLAAEAKHWAEHCDYKRGVKPFNADEVGFLILGQTLAVYDGAFDASQIVDKWSADSATFNPATQQCGSNQPCGAHNQLVWYATTDVGCAISHCDSVGGQSNANFLVCYFGPAASYDGDDKPFTTGAACTTCQSGQFYCNNGLCDTTCSSAGSGCECKADCKNCGTQTSDCTCKCKPGSSGVNCADECKDFHERCEQTAKNSWKQSQCTSDFPFVPRLCPKMCGLCEDGTPCSRSNKHGIYLDIPGMDRLIARAEKKIPGAEKKIPGAEKKIPGAEKKIPGAEKKIPGAEKKIPGAEKKIPGAEKKIPGAL